MSLTTDYGTAHRRALILSAHRDAIAWQQQADRIDAVIRAGRIATACHLALLDHRRAERERRAHTLAVHELGDLLAALAQRDRAAHDHLRDLMHRVAIDRQPIQALHSAARRYALALLEEDEGAQ